jgi:hypothetical protein
MTLISLIWERLFQEIQATDYQCHLCNLWFQSSSLMHRGALDSRGDE